MTSMQEVVGHKLSDQGRRPPKQGAAGRVCQAEDCDTVLSRYNNKVSCYRHSPTRYPRIRGRITRGDAAEFQDLVEP